MISKTIIYNYCKNRVIEKISNLKNKKGLLK